MSRYFQRPENALKKANEFIEVLKPSRALDTLYDVIKGKKHRPFSEKVLEPIMLKYLELCVELRKPHIAKEGLYQYRLMCQAVNVGLLEKVIRSYIRMAEEKTEVVKAAIEKRSEQAAEQGIAAIVEIDDLDNLSMADMTLLNVISEEQALERSGKAELIPWVKFLWESYTQCLDLLRNNPRLENLYHDIAQMSFKFCLAYGRKTEFRKLCDRLRKHFDDILNRQAYMINCVDFSSPETQQLNMETRLAQLDSAITLELWQEAYKAIEDIHLLMNHSKKSQTRMMAYYYQKLSLVFWKAGNYLFHAATLMKYYLLCKDMKKNVSADELQKNASQVVLATLAIPFPVIHPEFERFVETDKNMMEKSQKLATLLFLPQPPTRASMIRDIGRYGILQNAIKPLQDMYEILEVEFNPLDLCRDVLNLVETTTASSDYQTDYMEQYVDALKEVTLVRLIKQVSQLYQTIDYQHLLDMTVFSNPFQLEQILVDQVRYNDMQISIDHQSNCVKFGSSLAEASREDMPEGPYLQIMPSECVRLQLINVMDGLQEAVEMINPPEIQKEEDMMRSNIINQYHTTEVQYHRSLLERQRIINIRREELERSQIDKDYDERVRVEMMQKLQMKMEAMRIETEREEREKKKAEHEHNQMKARKLQDRIKQIRQTPIGLKIIEEFEGEEGSKLDIETVLQRQQEEIQKEAKEHAARLKAQEQRIDYLERAKRIEEIGVIEKYMENKKDDERLEWEAAENERIAHLIEERKVAVVNRDRLKRMRENKDVFLQSILDKRRGKFLKKLDEFNKDLQNVKSIRLQERKEMREQERRRKYEEEKAATERSRLDAIRKAEEEEERQKREKLAKELEERNRITLEKQLAKEREIEEREERERLERIKKESEPPAAPLPQTNVWRPKSLMSEQQKQSAPTIPREATTSSGVEPTPASPGVWVSKGIREKKAAALRGELPPQDSPRERPDRHERDRGEMERESDFYQRPRYDRDDRSFDRRMDRGEGDRGGERRGSDWSRGDRDGGDREYRWNKERGERGGDIWRRGPPSARDRADGRDSPSFRERGRDNREEQGNDDNWRRPVKKEEGAKARANP